MTAPPMSDVLISLVVLKSQVGPLVACSVLGWHNHARLPGALCPASFSQCSGSYLCVASSGLHDLLNDNKLFLISAKEVCRQQPGKPTHCIAGKIETGEASDLFGSYSISGQPCAADNRPACRAGSFQGFLSPLNF